MGALARWNLPRTSRWKRWLFGEVTARKCKVVVFTSNGDSCKVLLKAIPQLKGLKVFTSDEEEGDVLVVAASMGVVNGKQVPVIGELILHRQRPVAVQNWFSNWLLQSAERGVFYVYGNAIFGGWRPGGATCVS